MPVRALAGGRIAGAALDVSDDRPLPHDSPLRALGAVILAPHAAGITEDSMLRTGQTAAEKTLCILSGGLPRNFCHTLVAARCRARFAV